MKVVRSCKRHFRVSFGVSISWNLAEYLKKSSRMYSEGSGPLLHFAWIRHFYFALVNVRPFYMEKPWRKGHPPTRAIRTLGEPHFPTFLYKTYCVANRLHDKQKLALLATRVTLPDRPTFLHINASGLPSRVNLVKARQSEHARALVAQAKGSTFLSYLNAR